MRIVLTILLFLLNVGLMAGQIWLAVKLAKKFLLKKQKKQEEAAPKPSKIGFQQEPRAAPKNEVRLPLWHNKLRKIRRMFPSSGKPYHPLSVGKYQCVYFYDYCPDRNIRDEKDERNRTMILGFKDGEDAIPVHLVTDFIFKTIPYAERKDWLFCTIPASTREKNDKRNRHFCERVCEATGLKNGFSDIMILYDRTDSRHQKEDDTVWNLQFSTNVSGMKVLLFDDIVTRGISFIQCADKLMDKGAIWVDGIFLGRTLR
jgi:predicted amidophosphoribosyltransferase